MTGCWKSWIMNSVGPWNSNQATSGQRKLLQNFFFSLFENCTESSQPLWPSNHNRFPQPDSDLEKRENERGLISFRTSPFHHGVDKTGSDF